MEGDQQRWQPSLKRLTPILVATLIMFGWALFLRFAATDEPLSLVGLRRIRYRPSYFGLAAVEYAVVIVPLFVLTRLEDVRRALRGESPNLRKLFFIFVGLIALTVLYRINLIRLERDWVAWGVIVPLLAGLLGGWRFGLWVGFLAAFAQGAFEYGDHLYFSEDRFDIPQFIEWYFLKNTLAVALIWVGFVAGWWREMRAETTLVPTLMLGVFAEVGSFVFLFISYNDWVDFVTERSLANVLLTLLTLSALATLVRFLRDESLRREAEAQLLALSETQLTLANTELALAQAELRALHAQINPHFFFNSLNTIRFFIRTEPDKARTLLTRLSQIFQRVLYAGETIPLRDEIETVKAYLELEEARLEERLTILWTNLAEDKLDAIVPSLILQPIVENAVIHGIAPKPEGGTVHILIDSVGDDLLMQVSDDGVGFDVASSNSNDSIALGNISRRLTMRYGDTYTPTVQSTVDNGTKVTIRIPAGE